MAFLIIASIYAGLLVLLIPALLIKATVGLGIASVVGILFRICFFVTIPIVYSRLKIVQEATKQNL